MTRIASVRLVLSTPRSGGRDLRYPCIPSERKDPGETVFTRMPSLASDCDRFLVRLLRAALAAVYATRSGLCRFVEWAETLTTLANAPRRSNGRERRTVRTALKTPMSKVA